MSSCDQAFQEIQRLEAERRKIEEQLQRAREALDPDNKLDPAKVFVFRDRASGVDVEVAFDQVWDAIRRTDSRAMQDWAERALGERIKPVGSEGQFQNMRQLVDRIGVEDAQQMAAFVQSLTGAWEKANPGDFAAVTAINDKDAFAQRLADAFAEAGVKLDADKLSQAIVRDVTPFLSVLNRQTRLQVFSDITRQTLVEKVRALREHIETTGTPPTQELKWAVVDAGSKAIFAQRSAALSRRVSGQLLQQLQRNTLVAPEIAGRLFGDEVGKEAQRVFLPNAEDLLGEDSALGQVMEAAGRGVDGVKRLKQLEITLEVDGIDPLAEIDKDWAKLWRRQARAYYKDSQLFNYNTQVINNYLANKLVFLAEGYRKAFENGVKLRPVGTGFFRGLMDLDKTIQGARIAAEAGFIAHDAIRQGWADSIRSGFFEGRTPFASNPDLFFDKESIMPIEQQYAIANKVLYGDEGIPDDAGLGQKVGAALTKGLDANPAFWAFNYRDKAFLGLKLLGNHLILKQTGRRLPVTSALQMLAAVDQRAGLKVYMTARANQLLLDSFNDHQLSIKNAGGQLAAEEAQGLTWADRRALVRKQLDDELYQATPTPQNIKDARKQFGLEGTDLSDDEISAWLAKDKIGLPVLANEGQQEAFQLSRYARMQTPPEGALGALDKGIMGFRENPVVDALFPYWRSPMSQAIWDLKQSRPPIIQTAQVIFGKNPTQEQIAKTTGAWYSWLAMVSMWGALEGMGVIDGNGPIDPKEHAEWLAAGHKPNSVFGIPYNLGGLPILNTLFLYSDLYNNFVTGEYSNYDRRNAWMGLAQVAVGQLMRQTGWRQFQMLGDTLMSQSPRQWDRFLGFLANGQVNPLSGGMRQVERLTGTGSADLYEPRYKSPEDQYFLEQIGADDPLEQLRDRLRNLAYNSVPSLAYLGGQPLKETDYLGQKVVRPDGIFRGEWPIGMPGIWQTDRFRELRQEASLYPTLDRLGLLQPPRPLMDGRLDGVLMESGLEKEFNHYVGSTKAGPISDHPLFTRRLNVQLSAVEGEFDAGDRRRYETRTSVPVDLAPLLDRLTDGKTLREALHGLITSSSWRAWEADPRFTTNPKVKDRPRAQMLELPGPKAIKLLHDYYEVLATEQVELSKSPDAQLWRRQRDAKQALRTPDQVEADADALERTIR